MVKLDADVEAEGSIPHSDVFARFRNAFVFLQSAPPRLPRPQSKQESSSAPPLSGLPDETISSANSTRSSVAENLPTTDNQPAMLSGGSEALVGVELEALDNPAVGADQEGLLRDVEEQKTIEEADTTLIQELSSAPGRESSHTLVAPRDPSSLLDVGQQFDMSQTPIRERETSPDMPSSESTLRSLPASHLFSKHGRSRRGAPMMERSSTLPAVLSSHSQSDRGSIGDEMTDERPSNPVDDIRLASPVQNSQVSQQKIAPDMIEAIRETRGTLTGEVRNHETTQTRQPSHSRQPTSTSSNPNEAVAMAKDLGRNRTPSGTGSGTPIYGSPSSRMERRWSGQAAWPTDLHRRGSGRSTAASPYGGGSRRTSYYVESPPSIYHHREGTRSAVSFSSSRRHEIVPIILDFVGADQRTTSYVRVRDVVIPRA